MADLGNLKILLDMATTGNLKSTLENVDKRLDKMREKAASLQLGFDDKSISSFVTKMRDVADSMQEVSKNAGAKLAEGMKQAAEATEAQASSSQELVRVAKELEAAEHRLATAKQHATQAEETLLRRREKVADAQRSILKYQEDAELYSLRHKAGIESKDIDLLKKYLDVVKELKKTTAWNKGTNHEAWTATTDETVAIVERLAKKWSVAREEVERYFHTFSSYSGHRYDFSFDDKKGLYNLSLAQRSNEFTPGSEEKLQAYKESAKAAKDSVKELAEEEAHLHQAMDEAQAGFTSAKAAVAKETAEVERLSAAKKKLTETEKQSTASTHHAATSEMQQQVALSADLEALFKEMAGTLRTIAENHGKVAASTKASAAATKEATQEEQKRYDITRLRQIAEEKDGQLSADQISVLKQMEAIEKALLDIDQKHSTNLADQLKKWMHYDGVTKEQLGTYQALITRMQAAMKVEQKAAREAEKASRTQKAAAKEREAAARRQTQLELSIIRIETQLIGLGKTRLSNEAQLLVQKMRNQQITQEEASRLSAILSQEKAIVNAENQRLSAGTKINQIFSHQTGILSQIKSYLGTYVSVLGAVNLVKNLVRITGEFEAQHVALRAILQDVSGADRIFYQLQELAVKSPFTFRNLTDYAKQLSAFSVPMNEIYDTTKRLADVSAGLGVDMSRIILAYGQIRSASFLRGQEVRQLTEAGIPVLQELAKQFSEIEGRMISAGEVFDRISARQVPFEMIEKMFKDLTSAGGKFYQMQEVLAETVKGKVSNLQDAWEIMLSRIGDANSGTIKKAISTITEMLQNYETLIPALKAIALSLVSMKSVVGVLNTIQNIRIALINKETRALLLQKIAINGVAAALGIGVGIATYFIQKQRQANEEATELSRSMDSLSEDFRKIFSTFAVSWRGVEKAYERISNERHNAYKRALKENEGMLPNVSEAAKKLIEDSNKVVGPIETIKRKTQEVTAQTTETLAGLSEIADSLIKSTNKVVGPVETIQRKISEMSLYGGELEAAVVVADKSIKQLVSDGGELDAALVSASRSTKQLTSDGGELNAAIVTADAKVKQLVSNGGELEAAMVTAHKKVKQLVSDGGELEAALVSISKESSTLVSDGGEINAAIIVAEKKIKQLISDGGELDAAMITVDRDVKQLVSDGGELNAAVVTAVGKTLPKLNAELTGTVKATKELGLVGEPVRKSQKDIEKQFNASKQSTDEYKKALNELYEKYPNFIDENVRQKIAVEDLAGAWDIATQNMRQYYAEQATQQAHSILQKGYDKQTNDIIEKLNAELRTGRDYQSLRDRGLLNEGAIQLIDAYAMGLKTPEELSDDMKRLINLINSTGTHIQIYGNGEGAETGAKNLIDNARAQYEQATKGFREAIKASDDTIESEFTSSQHKKVMEYLLNAGLSKDSVLAMKNDEAGFETWEQWQERLRGMYKDTTEENMKAIEDVFSHFNLAVNPNELTPIQKSVSDWMKKNPAPIGVSLPGLEVKPETNISEFAENALKMMKEDEKELARLPKEFQKENEEQTWEEYAQELEDAGNTAHAAIARRRQYLLDLSEGVWGDDVFGSTKELAKKKKKEDQDYQKFLREQLENLRQQFQNLKEIKGWYDKLIKLGLSDTDTRKFLASFNMNVPAEGFNAAFDNLSRQFVKYGDKNTAQDVQNFKNGRDIKSDIDAMTASTKAIEKYIEALKDLEAQTKRLNLTGFAQELDKIIVDTDSKNRKLETDWAQKAEELEKAKDGWIQRYRIEHENDEALKKLTSRLGAIENISADSVSRLFTDSAKLAAAGWEDVTKAYAKAVEYVEKDGTKHNMLVSPVLPNGKVLSPKEFEEYISKAVSSADYRKMAPDSIVIGIDVKDDAKTKVAELQAAYSSLFENVGVDPEKRKEILKKALAGAGTGELDIAKAENDIKQIVERIKAIPGVEFLSEDSLDKLAELSGKISALQGKKVGLTVDVDKKSVEEEIASIEARIASLKNRPFKESENELVRLNARLIELKGQLAGVQMKVDTEDAKSELEDIKAEIRSIPGLSLLTDEQINKLGEASEALIRMKNLMDLKVRLVAETNDVNKKVEEIKERFGTLPITFTAADEITTRILADASGAKEELASLKKDVPLLSILAPDASAQLKALATRLNELKLGVDTEEARQEIKNVKDQIAAIPGVEVLSDSDIAKIAKISKLENIATSVTVDTASAENAISVIKEELSKNNELLPAEEIDKITDSILSLAQLKDKQINLSVNTNEADKELASLRDKVVSIPVVGQLGENELSRLASLFSEKPILQEVSIETDTSQIDNALSEINNRITAIPGVEAVSGDALSTLVQYSSLLGTTKKEIGALAVEEGDAAGSAEKAWQAFYDKQEAMARRYIERQKEYNRKVAQEQINDKASKWLDEMMKENNIDFHDMGDKSLEQVNILIERLEGLVSSESIASLIPDELKDDAALINVEFSELLSTIKKIANTKLGDLSVEKMKKTMKKVNGLASVMGLSVNSDAMSESFATLTQRLTEVANAEEDVKKAMDDLDKAQDPESGLDLAKAINKLSEAQEKLAKATNKSKEAQREFIISVSMFAVSTFASALTQAAKSMKELANVTNDVDLSKLADIFGEASQSLSAFASGYEKGGWIGAILNWYVDLLTQVFTKEIEIAAKAKQIRESIRAAFRDNSIKNFKESLDAVGESLFGDSALSKMAEASRRLSDIVTQIKNIKGTDGGDFISNTTRLIPNEDWTSFQTEATTSYRAVFTKQRNTHWGANDDLIGLEEASHELGIKLLDDFGNVNVELLRAIRDAGWDLTEEEKKWLDENIAILENYQTAMTQIADGLKSIFGQVGDSIAESIVSAFELSGEAALDTEDIFKSVARSFVKEWTQAFLMKNYLSGLSDAVTGIWQDTGLSADEQIAQSLDLVRDAFAAIGDQLPAIQKFYEGMEDQFHWADGAGEELGDAIKTAMVEQNSSLIAAYINSMRADLSMQRNEIMRSISPAVTNISTTLSDHLASVKSIEGNVANIWNKLNLLTSSGSGVKLNTRI